MKICLRCGKNFYNLGAHLSKRLCSVKYLDISTKQMANNYDQYYEQFKYLTKDLYRCEYCHHFFTKKTNYYRHKRSRCSKKSIITKLADKIDNNLIVDTDDVIINNFGEESPLSPHGLLELINECLCKNEVKEILPMYVQRRWIDNEKNRNVNITDLSRGFVEVYINKEWEKQFLNDVIDKIRKKSASDITKYLVSITRKLEQQFNIKYQDHPKVKPLYKVRNQIYDSENEPKDKKEANDKIKMKLVNGRKYVRKTKAMNYEGLIDPNDLI